MVSFSSTLNTLRLTAVWPNNTTVAAVPLLARGTLPGLMLALSLLSRLEPVTNLRLGGLLGCSSHRTALLNPVPPSLWLSTFRLPRSLEVGVKSSVGAPDLIHPSLFAILHRERLRRWFCPGTRQLVTGSRNRSLFYRVPNLEW